jgi:heavy metal sensor kinase
MRLSIRWRLTLWNTAALALGLASFAILVYGLVHRALHQRLDQQLREEFRELNQWTSKMDRTLEGLRFYIACMEGPESCVAFDAEGKALAWSKRLSEPSVAALSLQAPGAPRVYSTELPLVGRQRVCEGSYLTAEQPVTICLLLPLKDLDREMSLLLGVLATAISTVLALAGGLGYFLARKALDPIDRLRCLTEEITAERLDRRLPVGPAQDELDRLAATINAMIERLEGSFNEIRRFTADASHELRTPLTAIRTEAEVALLKPMDLKDYQHLLGSILEECDRLTHLTDQLLNLAREDSGVHAPPQSVDLVGLVRGVSDTMHPVAEAKGVDFEAQTNGPVRISGDETRLRQVFYNLLDNAIKYTPAGGTVRLTVEAKNEDAIVVVADSGIGIPPEHLPRVFDRFYRADRARSRAEGGTGLGLSIARTIVNAHGGQIRLDSAPAHGTTCTVTFPREPVDGAR